jgi:hypothetical protein
LPQIEDQRAGISPSAVAAMGVSQETSPGWLCHSPNTGDEWESVGMLLNGRKGL